MNQGILKIYMLCWIEIFTELINSVNVLGKYKMKSNIKWHKELVDGKWFSVADVEHVPMVEHCKDGSYKVRNCNGKAIIHKDFSNAKKLAVETYKKFRKFNKTFTKEA